MINHFINLDSNNPDQAILPFIIIGAILLGGTVLICAIEAVRNYLRTKAMNAVKAVIRSKTAKTVNVGIFDNFNRLSSVQTIECDTFNVSIGEAIYA